MDFRILGPLEVADGGREPVIPAGKQRALLAMLLLHANEVVSSDQLIEQLWGERPPESAAKRLQVHVSRLRHALNGEPGNGAEGVIVTSGGGYLVRVGLDDLDVTRFERLVDEGGAALIDGEPQRALELLREALALWRGPPLAEFTYDSFAQGEIVRLEKLHLTAVEQRIEADLALGRHAQAIGELESLVDLHPFRERLRAQLMLALYRAGRQTEALEVYREARRTLVDEVGVEPGEELRALERAVLAQDPALDVPRATREEAESRTAPDAPATRARRRGATTAALAVGLVVAAALVVVVARGGEDGDGGAPPLTSNSHAVAVIDPASNEVTDAVPVGPSPGPLAFEPRSRSVWVGNVDDKTVTRIDSRPLRAGRTVPVSARPTDLAAGNGAVWVAAAPRNEPFVTAQRIDTRFDSTRPPIPVDSLRGGNSAVALADGALWVAPSAGLLTRLDPATGRPQGTPIDPGQAPDAMAANGEAIWVADGPADAVSRIDARSGIAEPIPAPGWPADVALGARAAWVSLSEDESVAQIDATNGAVRHSIRVGRRPAGVAFGAGAVWVANSGDGTVSRIDPETARVTATIDVGASPQDVLVADGRVWVSVHPRPAAEPGTTSGTVRVEMSEDVDYLDPALAYVLPSWQILHATCAGLLNYPDRTGPAGARLQPEIAAAVPAPTDGGRTYTFRIRRGFRFSPGSGEAVTPQTIRSTVERTLHPRMHSPAQALLGDLVGLPAYAAGRARHISGVSVGRGTVTFRLVRPAPDFLARISLPFFCVVPPGTPIEPEGLPAVPAAGPYYVSSHVPGEQIVLTRNPNYHGSRERRPARVRIAVQVKESRAIARAEANRVDYVPIVSEASSARRLKRLYGQASDAAKSGEQRYFSTPLLGVDHLSFNTSRPTFASARLRRAVNYALDRRLLARRGIVRPLPAAPTDQYLPPGMVGFNDVQVYPMTPDLARARRLAGSERRTVVLYVHSGRSERRFASIVQANLRAIGMDVQIEDKGHSVYERAGRRGEPYDMLLNHWFADYPDPTTFLNLLDGRTIGPEGNLNLAYFNDRAYNRRLDAAATLPSSARALALGRLDAQVARTSAPWAAVAIERSHHFFSDRIGCQVFNPIFGLNLAALCIRPS